MNFKDKELIIFDLDGTLINSVPDLCIAVNSMLNHYHLSPINEDEIKPFIGNGAKILVERALKYKESEITPEFLNEAFEVYFEAYREVPYHKTFMYQGVEETLNYLKEKNYKMVICTNKPYEFIQPILENLNMEKFFLAWVGEDSLPEKKPNEAPLLYLAKKMNTDIQKCIMIGDSRNDIIAAQNAEMQSIGVSYGYNYNENIADYNPTIVVDNFADLKELF